ncbi:MAG: hypothetical protein AB7O50_15250 [Pseudolabrys sp.]
MKTSRMDAMRAKRCPQGEKSSDTGKLSGWRRCLRLSAPLVTGAVLLTAGCAQEKDWSSAYPPYAFGRAPYTPPQYAAPQGWQGNRNSTYSAPAYRPPAYTPPPAARVEEEPEPQRMPSLIPRAEAAPLRQPQRSYDPPPQAVEPASSSAGKCGWWRLRQLWC